MGSFDLRNRHWPRSAFIICYLFFVSPSCCQCIRGLVARVRFLALCERRSRSKRMSSTHSHVVSFLSRLARCTPRGGRRMSRTGNIWFCSHFKQSLILRHKDYFTNQTVFLDEHKPLNPCLNSFTDPIALRSANTLRTLLCIISGFPSYNTTRKCSSPTLSGL